jgi:glutamine amidotransferase
MCELFGASAMRTRRLTRWLEPFRARGGLAADNPDGWGIATWEAGGACIEKAPEPGAASARLAELAAGLAANLVVAHVRKARHPPVPGLRNTHPFAHACCGRDWVFAHNGLVPELVEAHPGNGFCRPQGETDSEHAFCHLLGEIAGCYRHAAHDDWVTHLARIAGTIAARGKFNFLLSDGDFLVAYGHDRLHRLERPGLALIVTEPLTSEPWLRFAPRELRVYRDGALVLRADSDIARSDGLFGMNASRAFGSPE